MPGAAVLLALCFCDPVVRAQPSQLDLFQRVSLTLRGKRLTREEREEIAGGVNRHETQETIVARYIDRWLATKEVISHKVDFYLFGPIRADRLFLGYLERTHVPGLKDWLYYLPHTLPPNAPAGSPPCGAADRVKVHPWWAVDQTVTLCAPSYRPEHVFDGAGYCASQSTFDAMPSPPRDGCGCGPLLLACLPPKDENPTLTGKIADEITNEMIETATDIVVNDRPFDEFMTTSRTWQTGLVSFLYLRRDLIGTLQNEPWTPALESELANRVRAVNLSEPGHWVDRDGVYKGSGLYSTTIAPRTYNVNYRDDAESVLRQFLCVDLKSVHVDSDALLRTIKKPELSEVWNSPMRLQNGCKDCHAPLDNLSGFLATMTDTRWGSHPIPTAQVRGELYVKGAGDRRGSGVGFAELSQLVIKQPDYDACMVKNAFEQLVGRPPLASERAFVADLTNKFHSGRSFRTLLRNILLGAPYQNVSPGGQ